MKQEGTSQGPDVDTAVNAQLALIWKYVRSNMPKVPDAAITAQPSDDDNPKLPVHHPPEMWRGPAPAAVIPRKYLGTPEEAARAVLHLGTHAACAMADPPISDLSGRRYHPKGFALQARNVNLEVTQSSKGSKGSGELVPGTLTDRAREDLAGVLAELGKVLPPYHNRASVSRRRDLWTGGTRGRPAHVVVSCACPWSIKIDPRQLTEGKAPRCDDCGQKYARPDSPSGAAANARAAG